MPREVDYTAPFVFLIMGIAFVATAAYGLVTGRAVSRYGFANRKDQPVTFWFCIAFQLGGGLMMIVLGLSQG